MVICMSGGISVEYEGNLGVIMVGLYIFLGLLAFIVLFFLSAKTVDPPPVANNDEEVKNIALGGRKMVAIKEYRKLHGVGLAEAKQAVEEMLKDIPVDQDEQQKLKEIKRMVNQGEKIAAIKEYRALYGIGLKDAKEAVELMQD